MMSTYFIFFSFLNLLAIILKTSQISAVKRKLFKAFPKCEKMEMLWYHAITDIRELVPKEERKRGKGGREEELLTSIHSRICPGSQLIHIL